MSARDVIEGCEAITLVCQQAQRSPLVIADGVVRALTAAGYRILGPDEVDPVTVERCASICDAIAETMYGHDRFLKPAGMFQVAASIRAIASGGKP